MQPPHCQLLALPQLLRDPQRLVHGAHRALQSKGMGTAAVSTLLGLPHVPLPLPTLAALQSATTSTLETNLGKSRAAGKVESGQSASGGTSQQIPELLKHWSTALPEAEGSSPRLELDDL